MDYGFDQTALGAVYKLLFLLKMRMVNGGLP